MSAQKSYEGKRFNVLYGIKLSSIEKCINIWVYLYWYIFFPINILWKGFPDNISYPSHQQSLPDVMLKITYELKRNEIKFPFKTKFFFTSHFGWGDFILLYSPLLFFLPTLILFLFFYPLLLSIQFSFTILFHSPGLKLLLTYCLLVQKAMISSITSEICKI